MSSVEGTDEMGELKRRAAILDSPVGKRVEHLFDLWQRHDEAATEEEELVIRTELFVVGSTVVADVLSALVRGADALESMANDARAGASVPHSSFTNLGEKR